MEEKEIAEVNESKKSNLLLPIVGIIIVIAGIMFFVSKQKTSIINTPTSILQTQVDGSQVISIEGGMFYFKPNEIRVKIGEKVKITFLNKAGLHDFVLDKFNVKSKQINAGESEVIEFTPNELGEFEFYCSVGNHRQQGMIGKLIVGN